MKQSSAYIDILLIVSHKNDVGFLLNPVVLVYKWAFDISMLWRDLGVADTRRSELPAHVSEYIGSDLELFTLSVSITSYSL